MSELLLEVEYLYYTLASVATLLVIAISWKVLSSKQTENKSSQNNDTQDAKNKDNKAEDLPEVDDLLIKSSEIKPLDSEDFQKLKKEGGGDSPIREAEDQNVKRVRAKELEQELTKEMTEDQLDEERSVREKQLSAIYQLMQDNQERFGVDSMEDVQSQYKLYA